MASPSPVFGDRSMLEMRSDLGGVPTPCVRNSPFEVADVILVLRDCDDSVGAAARELNLSAEQVYACQDCHREFPELVDSRIAACDFAAGITENVEVYAPFALDERARWDWRLAVR